MIGGEKVGRFSFLGTEPFLGSRPAGPRSRSSETGRRGRGPPVHVGRSVPRPPAAASSAIAPSPLPGLPRFAGGAVGYAAYDAVRYTENLPDVPPDDRGLPDLSFAFYDRMVLFDHIRKTILVVAQAHVGPGVGPQGRLPDGVRPGRRAGRSPGRARRPTWASATSTPTRRSRSSPGRTSPASEYEAVVRHCQEYIKAGDIFQVVPSQRFAIETTAEPFDIYRVLRVVNPSPFLFYLPYGDFALIGSSPEILVRVEDGLVTIRPLAGTRRRGARRGRGPRPGRGAAGRPQGAGRAHHAGRPGPQRRRPRRRLSARSSSPT